jgi:elongation factor Ts
MSITASQVKELRERTGVSMMECKKALVETAGDIEAAIELMCKNGMAKAAKKADRTAAEGAVFVKTSADGKSGTMVEINSETDFVARDENFTNFAQQVMTCAIDSHAEDVAKLMELNVEDTSLEKLREQLIAKLGEKIAVRRVDSLQTDGVLGSYVHGGRIGVLVTLEGGNVDLAKDIAMHIAAMRPQVVNPDEVSAELVEKEKEIFTSQAMESGKPAEIIEKIIGGRIKKFVDEVSLIGQVFVKDPSVKVGQLLKDNSAKVTGFVCYEVGEGIEKKEENFREEVMAQVKGSA